MQLRNVDLNLLVVLDALLREASVTGAGAELGLTTSATSHALGRLRALLGDPILVRAGRRMVLTERARALREPTHALLASAAELLAAEEELSPAELRRTFRIHATDHVVTVLGPGLDARVASEAPLVDLVFLPNPQDETTPLRDGRVDLGIGIYPELPPELRIQKLFDDRFVCALRRGHSAARRLSLSRYVELEHVLVAPRGRPGGAIDELLAEHGLARRIARTVPHFIAALLLVARTDYVVTISERLATALAKPLGLCIRPLPLPAEPYALSQIWHPRSDGDPAHRWLRQTLARAAKSLPRFAR